MVSAASLTLKWGRCHQLSRSWGVLFDMVVFAWAAVEASSPMLICVITHNTWHDKWLYVNPHPPGIKFKFVLGLHDYCLSYWPMSLLGLFPQITCWILIAFNCINCFCTLLVTRLWLKWVGQKKTIWIWFQSEIKITKYFSLFFCK